MARDKSVAGSPEEIDHNLHFKKYINGVNPKQKSSKAVNSYPEASDRTFDLLATTIFLATIIYWPFMFDGYTIPKLLVLST